MSGINKIACIYKNGEEIEYIENIFELNESQKKDLISYINQSTPSDLNKSPHKTKLTAEQKDTIIHFHKEMIQLLRETLSLDDDNQEFARQLKDNRIIFFTPHAGERIQERLTDNPDNIETSNSPFSGLKNELGLPDQTENELLLEAIEIFIQADVIGHKVEFNTSPFCRIDYSLKGDKTVLSVENRYIGNNIDRSFVVITAKNKTP
ncbi:hypothetical protein [Marinilactibacillus psychrotolerans]|uniref:Uncharacterized protein n=1 Tax=Marinilactibacillus psychrotolerans TaxID=191770 RepID=A0ABW8UJA9_9LACT